MPNQTVDGQSPVLKVLVKLINDATNTSFFKSITDSFNESFFPRQKGGGGGQNGSGDQNSSGGDGGGDTYGTFKKMLYKLANVDMDKAGSEYALGAKATSFAGDTLMKFVKGGFEILENIYDKIVKASPLLQTFEELFNLAMQLFFMPLGNKLGEILIPAVLELLDDVMGMWEEIGDGGLEEIFNKTFTMGINILVKFLNNIGQSLSEQGGLIGKIGHLILKVSDFLNDHLVHLIGFSISALSFIVEHIGLLLSTIVAFKIVSTALQLAQIAATLAPGWIKWIGLGALVAGVASTAFIGGNLGFAEGGHVDAVDGGQWINVGEGGEGEWIVPDNKVENFIHSQSITKGIKGPSGSLGGGSYTINVYGYTDRELGGIIEDKVNELSNRSRLRSGV